MGAVAANDASHAFAVRIKRCCRSAKSGRRNAEYEEREQKEEHRAEAADAREAATIPHLAARLLTLLSRRRGDVLLVEGLKRGGNLWIWVVFLHFYPK